MIQHAFSKSSLVNLISNDANLVYVDQLTSWFTLQTSDCDVIIVFHVDSTLLATSFTKCNVIHDVIKAQSVR